MHTFEPRVTDCSKTSVLGSPKGPDESDHSRKVTPIVGMFF